MKITHAAALSLLAALALTGCDKIKLPKFGRKTATPAPVPVAVAATPAPATPAPEPVATPPPAPVVDKTAQVIVLCYHRLEGKAGGALSIEGALFEKQMQEIGRAHV